MTSSVCISSRSHRLPASEAAPSCSDNRETVNKVGEFQNKYYSIHFKSFTSPSSLILTPNIDCSQPLTVHHTAVTIIINAEFLVRWLNMKKNSLINNLLLVVERLNSCSYKYIFICTSRSFVQHKYQTQEQYFKHGIQSY